jgi:hypothetical protein
MYRNIRTEAPEYEPLPFYTSEVEEEMDLATWLREASTNRKEEAEASEAAPFAVVTESAPDLPGASDQGDVAAGD